MFGQMVFFNACCTKVLWFTCIFADLYGVPLVFSAQGREEAGRAGRGVQVHLFLRKNREGLGFQWPVAVWPRDELGESTCCQGVKQIPPCRVENRAFPGIRTAHSLAWLARVVGWFGW